MADDRLIREAAATYGIDLDDDAVGEYRDTITDLDARLGELDYSLSANEAATSVTPGADPYGAFRYRCRVDGPDGPLADLTVAVKDNIAIAGVPMTCGSTAVSFTPSYHSTVVRRLTDAGATLIGTTNMDEFAYFATGEACAHGRVVNPRAEGYVPGGSSSGSGAAVAGDLVDAALGSDTGGSIRIPAAFCGVVGLKPTHRAVPRFGFADLAPSLDHIGPLADTVETAARTFDAIAGPDLRDPSTRFTDPATETSDAVGDPVDGLSLGVVTEAMAATDEPVQDQITTAVTSIESSGVSVADVSLPGYETAPTALSIITGIEFVTLVANNGQGYGIGTGYSPEWRDEIADLRARGGYGPILQDRLLEYGTLAQTTGGERYVAARTFEVEFIEGVLDALTQYDALITPTMPTPAPAFDEISTGAERFRLLTNTAPFDLSGHPAITVPAGEIDGRPVGLQIISDWNDEATAVRLASAVEHAY